MKSRIALLAFTLTALLISSGCGDDKKRTSLSSPGAIKKINKK